MSDQFGGAAFGRATEAPEEVVVTRGIALTQGLQPEDLGALVYLLLMPAGDLSSAKELAAGMRALGWRMSVDRFEVIAKRLMLAGHLHRESVYDPKTRRPQWRYWAYRNPANNPEYVEAGASELSQVACGIGENPVLEHPETRETGKNPVPPGQGRNREIPAFGKFPSSQDSVPAGHGRNREIPGSLAHPPHPPEEVETSSPYPLKASLGAARGEGGSSANNDEQIQAAYDFLQDLPNPWRAGRATARKLAPKLAEAVAEQGWSLDAELVKKLTEAPEGIKSYPSVLARRVDDLPRRGSPRLPGQQRERYSDVPERPENVGYADSEVNAAKIAAARAAMRQLNGKRS